MSYYKPIGNPEELLKKLPTNPKFTKVQTTLDTGCSATVMKKFQEYEVQTKQLPGENFKRMHPTTLAKYIDFVKQEELRKNNGENSRDVYAGDVWAGVVPVAEVPKKQILLLDVRDPEDYVKCHLQIAGSFHYTRVNRSTNIWTPEILKVINKDDWVIVLYDLQEEIVSKMNVANIFFEKGINNIMILAGGLREFAQRHQSLLVGECPVPIVDRPQLPPRSSVLSTATRSVCGGGNNNNNRSKAMTLAGSNLDGTESTVSRVTSMASSHKPKSLANSLARRSASASKGWR